MFAYETKTAELLGCLLTISKVQYHLQPPFQLRAWFSIIREWMSVDEVRKMFLNLIRVGPAVCVWGFPAERSSQGGRARESFFHLIFTELSRPLVAARGKTTRTALFIISSAPRRGEAGKTPPILGNHFRTIGAF